MGVGEGIGEALAKSCLDSGYDVYGVDNRDSQILSTKINYFFHAVDLANTDLIQDNLKDFVDNHHFDLVILNGGYLGDIEDLSESFLDELKHTMDMNVWNIKQFIDCLDLHSTVDQFVILDSGISIGHSKGWGGYTISKAALTALIKIYAEEKPWAHFSMVSPGVIMTPAIKKIFETVDLELYPSVQRIKDGPVLTPDHAAGRLVDAFGIIKNYKSGSYLDIRTIKF